MLAFLEAIYRHASGDPMHTVFDEADLWAPQNPSKTGAGPQLQSLMEQIVRRGRVKGFIPWLITQRPAVISKDVLSQADGLVAFKLTSSQDRAALGAWIEGQADREQGKEILGNLPTLQRGTGVVWIPARGILKTVDFPPKETFDSSRTPKRGEKKAHRDLKPLDLEGLKDRLSSVEAEAKANDPKALKSRVAELERQLAKAEKAKKPDPVPAAPALAQPAEDVLSAARTKGFVDGWEARGKADVEAMKRLPLPEGLLKANESGDPYEINWGKKSFTPRPARQPSEAPICNGSVPQGCSKPLAALAGVYPAGMTEAQWATSAGYKRTGGTWGTYKSRLRGAGLIEAREGKFFATEAGASAVGDVEMPPKPGPDLVRWWAAKLPGTSRMAEALIESWPEGLTKDELATRIDMAASGGSFGTYLSRLASAGVITRDGKIRLAAEIMEG